MKPAQPRFAELRPHIDRRKSKSAVPMPEQKCCCCVATDTEMADRARGKSANRDAGNQRGRQMSCDGSELMRGDEIEPKTGWHQPQINQCRHSGFPSVWRRGALLRLLASENVQGLQSMSY